MKDCIKNNCIQSINVPDMKDLMHVVIFTGGNHPAPEKTEAYWKNLPPPAFVAAADSGLEAYEEYKVFFSGQLNLPLNLITGDMDSLCDRGKLDAYPSELIMNFPVDKDYTDTELAIDRAITSAGKNPCFITLVGGSGGRCDHFMGIYGLFSNGLSPDCWLTETQALWRASSCLFTVSGLKPEDCVSVSRQCHYPAGGKIKSSGLEWESGVFRKEGMPSISNRISMEHYEKRLPVTIDFSEGDFVLYLPLSASVERKMHVNPF